VSDSTFSGAASLGVKLCECGCGEPTAIATRTRPQKGWVKGQAVRYRPGHNGRGRPRTAETRAKLSTARRGVNHANWRGDDIGYYTLHRYLRDTYPKSGVCDECGTKPVRTEFALIHGRSYTRDIRDYRELCRRCHMRYDGLLKLDDALIAAMCEMRARGATFGRIAAEHAISRTTVARALKARGQP
jgi:hypothetical protein